MQLNAEIQIFFHIRSILKNDLEVREKQSQISMNSTIN